ncbi:hypothetical protein FDA94_29030 [Herbidospora galbida]|uniref:4Fe-4S Wbl-type domain-containing protein n=1 Tax=Herbidospora galbida TaxID=2575442 RepID=A0A4U3M7Y8_9ACTN|nr:hypothetical protein FDA94_29030 [Herbidospora galbida]
MVMHLRLHAPDWIARGAKCIKFEPRRDCDPWFTPADEQDCVDICNGTWDGVVCPTRDKCLEYAAVNNESDGVWGGKTPEERHAMRQEVKHRYRLRPDLAPRSEWQWPTLN